MLRYTLHRMLLMIPTLIGVAVLVFFMLRVIPGDVVEVKLRGDGGNVSQETIEMERKRLGLDKPLLYQFKDWMVGLATLDLGKSMWTDRPVTEEIALRLELSLQVAIMASFIAVLLAIPLGTTAALMRGTWVDYAVRIITIGGLSIPSFWFGMLIMITLLYLFNWLPPITFTPIYVDPVANLQQLIWPAMAVGYRYCAVVARMIRSSLLEVLNEDYIRTARAKGVYEKMVISRHALRNALLPAITVIGIEFAFLIGGLVVTEQVFNLNGIGMLFVQSVSRNDFTLIQALVMLVAGAYVVINLDRRPALRGVRPAHPVQLMAVAALPSAPVLPRRRSAIVDFTRQQPLGAVSFVVIFVMMFAGIFAEYVSPYNPLDIDFAGILSPPSWDHWAGTDAYGRDILSRIIYGSRTALVIGFTSSFIGSTIGAVLGIASAYFGGKIDDWIQRFVDILLAFPIIVLALVVVAALRKFVIAGHRREPDLRDRDPDRAARRARGARRGALDPHDALRRCGARGRLLQQPHHLPPHGAERGRAVPHHVHGVHRAGDPARSLALLPRPRRDRADAGMGPDALRQRGRLLPRGAVDDPVPGRGDQPCGVRLQPVRRFTCATISTHASRPERLRASLPAKIKGGVSHAEIACRGARHARRYRARRRAGLSRRGPSPRSFRPRPAARPTPSPASC